MDPHPVQLSDDAVAQPVHLGGAVSLRADAEAAARWDEHVAAAAAHGLRHVRLGIDWASLQPRPGDFDDDWTERYRSMLEAAKRHGVDVIAGLHDGCEPGWFVDEGSFGDERSAGRWWPRWVEGAAERFGDLVGGWAPMRDPIFIAERWAPDPRRHPAAVRAVVIGWRDAWRILRGGPPVSTELGVLMPRLTGDGIPEREAARHVDRLRWRVWGTALRDGVIDLPGSSDQPVADLAGSLDVLGLTTFVDVGGDTVLTDQGCDDWSERLGTILRRAGEQGPTRPISVMLRHDVTGSSGPAGEPVSQRDATTLAEVSVDALRAAQRDGVDLSSITVDPFMTRQATDQPATTALGLLDRDHETTDPGAVWIAAFGKKTNRA